jgi:hypothetical protein
VCQLGECSEDEGVADGRTIGRDPRKRDPRKPGTDSDLHDIGARSNKLSLDLTLNGLEWTLFAWRESLLGPQQASHTRRKCWYRMQVGGDYAASR